ncbi:sushi, von Willebrand factor type A, EGF and pentraxin domain-containing protein 1-like [Lingula anatina]|uniref:Sushi, von Willebrand factor type A, EGF and pentraxin domain-containing protein 1-like n=1 Tax=Lingula anatina TaxID=7574 RepID=A0A1S3HX12_LINAN|nr:sushi, von Willebrand factor type A, EGF and pentraxin domain-containing protein 1-like [Lingula anatina]|eukprot:XP_013390582.1 sushi, von Willebrand factor type A, EGF and pentraxin domain-containing protein 1-like [Lingula anatina]
MRFHGTALSFSLICLLVTGTRSQGVTTIGNVISGQMNTFSKNAREVVDLMFLLDESGSVGSGNFRTELEFVRNIMEHFSVAPQYTQVGLITFGSDAKPHMSLDMRLDKCDFMTRLNGVGYRGGMTNMNQAFGQAKQNFDRAKNTGRGALKVVFLISDGWWNDGGNPQGIADQIKADGGEIAAIGVGGWDKGKLKSLASIGSDGKPMVYDIRTFTQFRDLARYFHKGQQKFEYLPVQTQKCGSRCQSGAFCSCDSVSGKTYKCACNAGFHLKRESSIERCLKCEAGTYSDSKSTEDKCRSCAATNPFTTTLNIGSRSPNDCVCQVGYTNVNTNLKNGDPINRTPPCKEVTCRKLVAKPNSFLQGYCGQKVNNMCTFNCEPGYKLRQGDINVLKCQTNGKWSGTEPLCEAVLCPALTQNPVPYAFPWSCTNSKGGAGNALGAVCKTNCKPGYVGQGDTTRTCKQDGTWSGQELICSPITCPSLNNPNHGKFEPASCLQQGYAGATTCTLICDSGFTIVGNQEVVCTADGTYDKQEGYCNDTQPPTVTYCPSHRETDADPDSDQAIVSLINDPPRATDNSGEDPSVEIAVGSAKITAQNSYPFKIGETRVTYTFKDAKENQRVCTFKVIVKDTQPPKVVNCPDTINIESKLLETDVTWEEPTFRDNSDKTKIIHGQPNMTPGKFRYGRYNIIYEATDPSGNKGICKFKLTVRPHPCPELNPPINGALSCDTIFFGFVCFPFCQNPYEFNLQPGQFFVAQQFVCGGSGQWYPSPQMAMADCTKFQDPARRLLFDLHYYEGSCPEASTQDQIKENAAQIFRSSSFGQACNCNVTKDDFRVICGAINTTAVQGTQPTPVGRRRRELDDLSELLKNLKSQFVSQLGVATIEEKDEGIGCARGEETRMKGSEITCVVCTKGYFYNSESGKCTKCPAGYYSDQERALQCKRCPAGTLALKEGSFSRDNCSDICQPGTFSPNGVDEPDACSPCPVNQYQDKAKQTSCIPCPSGTFTVFKGAESVNKCKATCPPGYWSGTGLQPCQPCEKNTYTSQTGSTKCTQCSSGLVTRGKGSTSSNMCIDFNECSTRPCLNGAQCHDLFDDYRCDCPAGFTGKNCEANIDDCESVPCQNGATCHDRINSYSCSCVPGYTGPDCSINIDECAQNPCQNGATCTDGVNDFNCACPPGYSGKRCQTDDDECASGPCENGGICTDGVNSYTCSCPPGFSGPNCGQNIDDCKHIACDNGGTCVDGINSHTCSCVPGFTGINCEININECAGSPCVRGTCIDDVNDYYCACPHYYSGKNCERRETPCFNIDFTSATENDYVFVDPRPAVPAMSEITLQFWMKSDDSNEVLANYGTPVSYGDQRNDHFTIFGQNNFMLMVNDDAAPTGMNAADGAWHKICLTWTSNAGNWEIYNNGKLHRTGTGLSSGKPIPAGGRFVLGQKINGLETFSPTDTFSGVLHGMKVWNKIKDCTQDINDDHLLKAWPDLAQNMVGRIHKTNNVPCK